MGGTQRRLNEVMKVKKKWICIIVGIIFIFYLILIIFFNIFPIYLNSAGMKSDYAESVLSLIHI